MPVSAEALDIILRIQGLRGFQGGMRQAAASTRDVGRAAVESSAQSSAAMNKQLGMMGMVRKAAIGLGIAFVAAGVEAYKLNTNFDKQLTMIQAEAGASAQEVANMRTQILQLAGPLRQNPEELAKGLYHVESLGFRGAKALDILKDSAHMANISGANLEETTTALGGAMIVGVRGAGSLSNTMGTLVATAGAGNMRMQNLVDALGTGLLSAAKNANMTLLDTGAALATLTDTGMPASSAAAQLRTALHFLYSPTKRAHDALKTLGLSQRDLVEQIQGPNGLAGALSLLDTHLNAYAGSDNAKRLNIFGHILPGGRGQVLLTLMKNLDQYDLKNKQIAKTIAHTGEGVRVSESTNASKLNGAWADLQATLISVADTYKGPMTSALVTLIGFLAWLAKELNKHKKIVISVGVAIGIMTGLWITYQAAMIGAVAIQGAMNLAMGIWVAMSLVKEIRSLADAWVLLDMAIAANPIGLIIVAVIALIAFFVVLYMKWGWFHRAVDNTWNFIKDHWKLLGAIMLGPIAPAAAAVYELLTHLQQVYDLAVKTKQLLEPDKPASFDHKKVTATNVGALGSDQSLAQRVLGVVFGDDKSKGPSSKINPLKPVMVGPSMWEPRRHNSGTTQSKSLSDKERIDNYVHVYLDSKEITAAVNKTNANRKARK